jgi:hypothetical protein
MPEVQARKVLTYAFAAEVLELMPWADVRSRLEAEVMRRLHVQVEG